MSDHRPRVGQGGVRQRVRRDSRTGQILCTVPDDLTLSSVGDARYRLLSAVKQGLDRYQAALDKNKCRLCDVHARTAKKAGTVSRGGRTGVGVDGPKISKALSDLDKDKEIPVGAHACSGDMTEGDVI